MFGPKFVIYSPPAYVDFWFDVPEGDPEPTKPKLIINYDYIQGDLAYDPLLLEYHYTERYDDIGHYEVKATVYNLLDSKVSIKYCCRNNTTRF